jgi:hypothetical protein
LTSPATGYRPTPIGGGPVSSVPVKHWTEVHKYVNQQWDPENSPHHSIIGLTGSGKSFLAVNGILKPMCPMDRVLIVDVKKDDKLVSSIGQPVTEIPKKTWQTRKREPFDSWFRLTVHDQFRTDGRAKARGQVFRALERIYHEGNWVIYFDEVQDIGGIRQPNLGLGMHLDELYRKGRSRHISVLATTQAPRHVPTSFYDQASFAWIGRLSDEDKQKRLREIGGLHKTQLPVIQSLKKRHWLLCHNGAKQGEEFMVTTVKLGGDTK